MIKLDGYLYGVEAENHVEAQSIPRRITKNLGGQIMTTTGQGKPRVWRYTLLVCNADYPGKRAGEGDIVTIWATYAKTDPSVNRLEFYDERTVVSSGIPTCNVVISSSELSVVPIGQVLTEAKYEVEIELTEALS
jgi:hypothetical protein